MRVEWKMLLAATSVIAVATSAARAEDMNPGFVYAARLVGADGKPLKPGAQPYRAELWDAATGGTKLWTGEGQGVVTGTNGAFSVTIGDGNAGFRTALQNLSVQGKDGYLQMSLLKTATGDFTLPVRQKLGRAAVATVADRVSTISADFLAQGPVTLKDGLTVTGAADFGALTHVGSSLNVGGVMVVSNGTVTTKGNMIVGGTLTVQEIEIGSKTGNSAKSKQGSEVPNLSAGGTWTVGQLAVKGSAKAGNADIAFPKGAIVMWNGPRSQIPPDWHICDGTAQTPDLRGFFVIGGRLNEADLGTKKQGSDQVTLDVTQMPSHQHEIDGNQFKKFGYWASKVICRDPNYLVDQGNADKQSSTSTGGGKAHENRPPYYALYYIMKTK